jgi:hypothetical protein
VVPQYLVEDQWAVSGVLLAGKAGAYILLTN